MEQADSLTSQHVPGGITRACAQPLELEVRTEKVDRAAADLQADYQRQNGLLRQAQFDRLVLRRNLTPREMVALIAKLASMGVVLNEPRGSASSDDQSPTPGAVPKDEGPRDSASLGQPRNPYALVSHREEIELGRRIQLALRTQAELDPTKVDTPEAKDLIK